MLKRTSLFAGIIATTACQIVPPPPAVPVQGEQSEISAFAGEWAGRYSSKATGRHGIIRFNLPERADTGYGEVEITFSPALRLTRDAADVDSRAGAPYDLETQPTTVVDITVVRIEGDAVRGTMIPYWDPDCDCRAHTVFEGKLENRRIVGTFSTRRESSQQRIVEGEWKVERGKP